MREAEEDGVEGGTNCCCCDGEEEEEATGPPAVEAVVARATPALVSFEDDGVVEASSEVELASLLLLPILLGALGTTTMMGDGVDTDSASAVMIVGTAVTMGDCNTTPVASCC